MAKNSTLMSYQGLRSDTSYSGDNRNGVSLNRTLTTAPTAFTVGHWILARQNGEPLSAIAHKYCDQAIAGTNNKALQWLIQDLVRQ